MRTLIDLMQHYNATTIFRHNDLVGVKNRITRLYDWYRFYPGEGYKQAGSTARLPEGSRRGTTIQ